MFMKKIVPLIILGSLIMACSTKNQKLQLGFLDEYIIPDSTFYENILIGGISAIDHIKKDEYLMVVDDAHNPRLLKADIDIVGDTIIGINFNEVIKLNDSLTDFYKESWLDLESGFITNSDEIILASEGSIKKSKDPAIFKIDDKGKFIGNYKIPKYFKANSKAKPKHNGVFEGSCMSFSKEGFWVAMEAPLELDGPEPTFYKTKSPVRITYFDNKTKTATKQFVYELEKIDKPKQGNINLNGLTAILEYAENKFFIIERMYQSGYGSHGNTIRIFKATANRHTTNTLNEGYLKDQNYIPLKKELLFDFARIKEKLTDKIIDNIEGITFGPELSNGNQSLILVADDNFQLYGKQLNQFILLEIKNN